jgi:hypothetical protein
MRRFAKILNNRIRLNEAYRRVFSSPDGEIVLAHLAKVNFVFSSTLVAGDTHLTAMNEGQRRLVLSIMRQLDVDLTKLQEISEEIHNEN